MEEGERGKGENNAPNIPLPLLLVLREVQSVLGILDGRPEFAKLCTTPRKRRKERKLARGGGRKASLTAQKGGKLRETVKGGTECTLECYVDLREGREGSISDFVTPLPFLASTTR